MTQTGKDLFFDSLILDEKIELTKQSLQLTQNLQCGEHQIIIDIKSAPRLSDCHARLYLYNSKTERWNELINLDQYLIVTPANLAYEEYKRKFGNTICSSKNSIYFKAIMSIMGTDRSNLLRLAKQKLL